MHNKTLRLKQKSASIHRGSRSFFRRKFASLIISFLFLFNQITPAYSVDLRLTPYENSEEASIPERSVDFTAVPETEPSDLEEDPLVFYGDDTPLSPAEAEEGEARGHSGGNEGYVTEVYETPSEGIGEIQPGTPVAYLADHLTREDLRRLREAESEVGLLIAGDRVVIYSTGDEHFIQALQPVRELSEDPIVSLRAHFHRNGPPSEVDLHPDAGFEYVVGVSEAGEEVVWVQENERIIEIEKPRQRFVRDVEPEDNREDPPRIGLP